MLLIRCTGKLRKEMGLKDSALFQGQALEADLRQWHANLIHISRRKCVLFVNDKTLFNFIAPNVSRTEIRGLQYLFLSYLNAVLSEEGFDTEERNAICSEHEDLEFAKTSSKSVLGSLNDLAFHYKHRILMAGGVQSHKIPSIIGELNRMPMGALKYAFPIDELHKAVRERHRM